MKRIYLDNSATTPPDPQVVREMAEWSARHFGNPSSVHAFGREAKIKIEEARAKLADLIGAQPGEIIFTSGGTEANNLAVIGAAKAQADRGQQILLSAVEHPSVLKTANYLHANGLNVDFISPDPQGVVTLEQLQKAQTAQTVLVSIMHVNNETGIIHPVGEIAAWCREHGILFHCDVVQSFGKLPVTIREIPADLLTFSAHKIHGPKGVGALYVRKGVALEPLLFGGGQEANRRPGTENLTGIVGFDAVLELLTKQQENFNRLTELQGFFERSLKAIKDDIRIVGESVVRSPYISNVIFPGIDNESFLLNLDMAGIAASAGSACSSGSVQPSHVLSAMGFSERDVKSAVRFSFARTTTMEELNEALLRIREIVNRLSADPSKSPRPA